MTDVKRYIARPIEVQAVKLNQYGDFVRAAAWITESKARETAYFKPKSKLNGNIDTLVLLKDGNVYDIQQGDYVILTSEGSFGFVAGHLFEAAYDEVADENHFSDWGMESTSRYHPKGKEGTSLLGAAALQMPE
jgi:hypothetical protein